MQTSCVRPRSGANNTRPSCCRGRTPGRKSYPATKGHQKQLGQAPELFFPEAAETGAGKYLSYCLGI